MDCFCGCGTKVPRKLTAVNLEASKVAVELLAWDKARTANPPATADIPDAEALIARGAGCFRRLIAAIHGEDDPDPLSDCEDWLADSFEARKEQPEITTKGSLLSQPSLTLTNVDYSRLDRKRPERSFSDLTPEPGGPRMSDRDLVSVRYMIDDVQEALDFYVELFGFEVRFSAAPAFADVARGHLRLLLSGPESSAGRPMPDGRQPGPGGWNRIHFIVEDIDAEVERLRQAGVTFRNEIVSGPGGRQIVLDDPSGNPIEIFQPAER